MPPAGKSIPINTKFGMWTVIGEVIIQKGKKRRFPVRCICGLVTTVDSNSLRSGDSGGCRACTMKKSLIEGVRTPPKKINRNPAMLGETFGEWTVLSSAGIVDRTRTWNVQCSCGFISVKSTGQLKGGRHQRCLNCSKKRDIIYDGGLGHEYNDLVLAASRRGLECKLTYDQWEEIVLEPCFYCQKEPSQYAGGARKIKEVALVNGVDRWDPRMGYCVQNAVPSCFGCNQKKWERHGDDYCREIVEGPSLLS